MHKQPIALLFALFLLLFLRPSVVAQEKQSAPEIKTGAIVAHNRTGIVRANGNCRQTIIVRTTAKGKNHQEAAYIVVRHDTDCVKAIPDKTLNASRQLRFSLIRNIDCDEMLDSLMYLRQLSPTGGISKDELLWFVPGMEVEKIPADKKLPCYFLSPAGFEPLEPVRR